MAVVKISTSVPTEMWESIQAHFPNMPTAKIFRLAMQALVEKEEIEIFIPVLVKSSQIAQLQELGLELRVPGQNDKEVPVLVRAEQLSTVLEQLGREPQQEVDDA